MRKWWNLLLVIVLTVVLATQAFAGVLGTVKGWITGEVVALVASALLAIVAGTLGILFKKISRTFKEAGEFLTTLGTALEDRKLTREELGAIVKEGKDIFAVW